MTSKDPLTQLHEALWDLLEADTDFAALVPAKNRIKYVGTDALKYPEAGSRQADGYPQVTIQPASGSVHYLYASCAADKLHERFQVMVWTGAKPASYLQGSRYQGLFPVKWCIYKAMRAGLLTIGTSVTLTGYEVHVAYMGGGGNETQLGSPRIEGQNAPVKSMGWNLAWQGDFEIWIK